MAATGDNGHARRRQRTRAAILRSAADLFESGDYAAITVAEIAARANVSERTFYTHFPAKVDLLFAHVPDLAELALRVVDDSESTHPAEVVRAAVRAMIDAVYGHDSLGEQATLRATVGAHGDLPRALAGQLTALTRDLSRQVAAATDTPADAVAPMVGAAVGAVGAAGLVHATGSQDASSLHDTMTAALDAALVGFADRLG